MSLGWRLILSYIIIIVISLLLAFVTLILISRPLQTRLIRRQLSMHIRQIGPEINNLYNQSKSPENVIQQLNLLNTDGNRRLIFLDPGGVILADSQNSWAGHQLTLPEDNGRGFITAIFNDATGRPFIYVAAPVGTPDQHAGYVAAVAPQPPTLPNIVTDLGWGFVAAGLVALLVSLLLSIFTARSIALPLQGIAAVAGAVAAGDYEHRLSETGLPEIKRVTASFNLMLERVEVSQRVMRDFVSNVSHELKTPLTSIQGFSQALMEGATQDEETRRRAASIIHQEATRMSRLVEDLLDLARIDAGQIVMNKTPLDLAQMLTNTVNRLLPQAVQKQVEIVKKWGKLPAVVGDGDRLAQVFTNLLDNAVRHTPAGGAVTIMSNIATGLPRPRRTRAGLIQLDATTTISERGDFVEISIIDTGPGISSEDLARIFERFYQVDKSRKRGRGAGLGLAITKEIVDAHGGYLRAESIEGVGAKFTVVLPITEADVLTLVSARR